MTLIRKLNFEKDLIITLIYSIEEFSHEEKKLSADVIRDAQTDSDYQIFVATDDNNKNVPIGFICFGKIPLTKNAFDLYWVAVEKSRRRRGVAHSLHEKAIEEIKKQNGKIIRVETSSSKKNKDARSFYETLNYDRVSKILDFYDSNDDLVTYILEL